MSAARYVGRVGGLAVALGVNVAVFTGHGIASAEPDSDIGTPGSSAVSAAGGSSSDDPAGADQTGAAGSGGGGASPTDGSPAPSGGGLARRQEGPTSKLNGAEITRGPGEVDEPKRVRSKGNRSTAVKAPDATQDDETLDSSRDTRVSTDEPNDPATTLSANVVDVAANAVRKAPPTPAAPGNTSLALMTLASTRREVEATPSAAQTITSGPIAYVPNVTLVADPTSPLSGVISSSVVGTDFTGLPLTYALLSGPSAGGKVSLNAATGTFVFLPSASTFTSPTRAESFAILAHEVTPFVAALTPLQTLPVLGPVVNQALLQLYQVPVLNVLLAPLIGYSTTAVVVVDLDDVNPGGIPIAFTTTVTSFDGTPISTNWFPALGLSSESMAPTVLNGPGLGSSGIIDPSTVVDVTYVAPGLAPLRAAGYNVVTWDPRGVAGSGGVLQINNPAFEGRDVSAIVDWVAQRSQSLLDAGGDPRIGMVGGSYGGGIQLVTAANDHRVDAIVPTLAWNTLTGSLYPRETFKTAFSSLLLLSLVQAGATINPAIYTGLTTGALLGVLGPSDVALLAASGPGDLVGQITAPTLLVQGTADTLFPLQQAVLNAQLLAAKGVPVKMIWYCGGHGVCLDPVDIGAQAVSILGDQLAWLEQYVKRTGTAADAIPTFQWTDQRGDFFSSDLMPYDPAFRGTPVTAAGSGGLLPILPLQGASGPQALPAGVPPGLEFAMASRAATALDLGVAVPGGTQIVGAPEVTFSYAGFGTSRAVFAQIVDEASGRVLGNVVTPISVILDGQTRTVTLSEGQLADIAYTAPAAGGRLTVQLVATATPFANVTAAGAMYVLGMAVSLPTVAPTVVTSDPVVGSRGRLVGVG